MLKLPRAETNQNVLALARRHRDRITGVTGSTLTLSNAVAALVDGSGTELVHKNGAVLDPAADYTVSGKTVTLTTPAIITDVFLIDYQYRGTP